MSERLVRLDGPDAKQVIRRRSLLLPLLLLSACGSAPEPAQPDSAQASHAPTVGEAEPEAAPTLAACEAYAPNAVEEDLRLREGPLPVPEAMMPILAADHDHYAVLTLGGQTLCIDTRWMDSVDKMRLTDDGRFLSFDWYGYEAYGHQIVDRSGAGQAIDTGIRPVRSPSGRRLAALDRTEAGYGALDAFGVWEIGRAGLTELARIDELPPVTDWRIDRWVGEECLELSGVAFDDLPEDYEQIASAPRQRFIARRARRQWSVSGAATGACRGA